MEATSDTEGIAPTTVPTIDAAAQLAAIKTQLKSNNDASPVTVRTFLSWFGIHRRGYFKVRIIRAALKDAGLKTVPDFESAYIDSPITFELASVTGSSNVAVQIGVSGTASVSMVASLAAAEGIAIPALVGGSTADPTYRIGKLAAANKPPISMKPEGSLQEVVTLLLSNDFSQVPVMQSDYSVKGMVSWKSIGSRLALGQDGTKAEDFMEPAVVISSDASLFAVIGRLLGRVCPHSRRKNRIIGIVTTSDLSVQFGQLSEPFLLLGEIENHVRRLIDGKFTLEEVKAACDPGDPSREVTSVADLTSVSM
jgi:CBS domain-containing protein